MAENKKQKETTKNQKRAVNEKETKEKWFLGRPNTTTWVCGALYGPTRSMATTFPST
jgi:hypothetical protein